MTRLRILLVDDDPGFLRQFIVHGRGLFDITTARTSKEALQATRDIQPDAVLLDINLGSGGNGIEVLRELRVRDPDLPVIMVSGDESVETIVEALKAGANDYVSKSPNLKVLTLKIEHELEQSAWRAHAREIQGADAGELVGKSAAMRTLREEIARVGPKKVRVLVRGESGTGKELVAWALHLASPRRHEKFRAISGASGTDELFDAAFFGHEKSAFTGAERQSLGELELARGGTLFLDEIGKMSTERQAKLLRVVETARFQRLGGHDDVPCDVRLITASNEDIDAAIRERRFLADLYYRVAEYQIEVPPLRERMEDIPLLTRTLADRFTRAEPRRPAEWNQDALAPLFDYAWPGNVRQLDSVVKRAMILRSSGGLTADDFATALRGVSGAIRDTQAGPNLRTLADESVAPGTSTLESFLGTDFKESRERLELAFERLFVARELARSDGNVSRAARRMRIHRTTLYRRLVELGLRADANNGEDSSDD
jgi:DNA-binding NtrC family response regulator